MKMKKLLCIIASLSYLLIIGGSLTSADALEQGIETEFLFDNHVSWNSSLDNLQNYYGTLTKLPENQYRAQVVYKNGIAYKFDLYLLESFNCCGYSGFEVYFAFIQETSELIRISLECRPHPTFQMFSDIENALNTKYGKATTYRNHWILDEEVDPTDVYTSEWKDVINNTTIVCTFIGESKNDKTSSLNIHYYNDIYSDELITETTPSPTQQPMNGI